MAEVINAYSLVFYSAVNSGSIDLVLVASLGSYTLGAREEVEDTLWETERPYIEVLVHDAAAHTMHVTVRSMTWSRLPATPPSPSMSAGRLEIPLVGTEDSFVLEIAAMDSNGTNVASRSQTVVIKHTLTIVPEVP